MPGAPDSSGAPSSLGAIAPLLESVFEEDPSGLACNLGERLFVPQVNWSSLSFAAFAANGVHIASCGQFPVLDPAVVEQISKGRSRDFEPVKVRLSDGAQTVIAFVEPRIAQRWDLPDDARTVVDAAQSGLVGIWISSMRAPSGLVWACERLGLTPLQSRIVSELVCCGDLRKAAAIANVTYPTARDALADAMMRAGVNKRSALIERIACLSFGVLPEESGPADILKDIWGLSTRQAQLAIALAEGASRRDAARGAGVSEAVAKKELALVFEMLGVSSSAGLTAYLSEAASIAALSRLVADDIHFSFDRSEPLRLIPAPRGGRMIAFSDYGPRTGRPVLVLHSSSASRPVPTLLVAALHARGFRPISIDRPGFGLTDPMEGSGDPFELACDDIRTVCDALGAGAIDIIARGGAQVVLHLAAQSPERVGQVVLVAPDPPTRVSKPTVGTLGEIKRAIQSNPMVMEALSRVLVSSLRRIDARVMIERAVGASAPDMKVMEDPRNFTDYKRGFQMFLSGRLKGYVREQTALATEPDPPRPVNVSHWQVLIGAHDPLHDPNNIEGYWRTLLPEARFTILQDAGRFIVKSHPELVADALLQDVSEMGVPAHRPNMLTSSAQPTV
jgi:pimeloyl-ACP methyl ester carboxylesterase/DNA-binding CsgD family transcriptional regulator